MTCSLCDKPMLARGWCSMHYQRWLKHGDPNVLLLKRGLQPAYTASHMRLRRTRGKASGYLCVDCGRQASHWSYKNGGGGGYSANSDDYEPRCGTCHAKFDRPPKPLCSIDGCDSKNHARSMCQKHYKRWNKKRVAKRNTTPRKK